MGVALSRIITSNFFISSTSSYSVMLSFIFIPFFTSWAGRYASAGAVFGLAVHWRVYPIIYALPIMRHLAMQAASGPRKTPTRQTRSKKQASNQSGLASRAIASVVSVRGILFAVPAAAAFLGLGAVLYRMYGMQFLHETYLYHASRVDPRHNFSPYFYPAYLGTAAPWPQGGWLGAFLGDSGR